MGISRGAVLGKSIRLNLHFRKKRGGITLSDLHDAAISARTLFPTRRRNPRHSGALKTASWQRKIGGVVKKGHWRGMPIYALTLEERATCPRSCQQWHSCYGNGMQAASRIEHGPTLEFTLIAELAHLQELHPRGFVVRLHILGDFYSVSYVQMWRDALEEFPALRVFGYSAWPMDTEIGRAVSALRDERWDRFAVRTSGADIGTRANVYASRADVPKGEIVCPAQIDKTASCATCALCWSTRRPIAFLKH